MSNQTLDTAANAHLLCNQRRYLHGPSRLRALVNPYRRDDDAVFLTFSARSFRSVLTEPTLIHLHLVPVRYYRSTCHVMSSSVPRL